MLYFSKEFRSFHTGDMGSVGQMASKLLAVKFLVLKKKSAASAMPAEVLASTFSPGSSPPVGELFSKV